MGHPILCETKDSTLVANYTPSTHADTAYQSEAKLEDSFIKKLGQLGYEYLHLPTDESHDKFLVENIRSELERLNKIQFTDKEWKSFSEEALFIGKAGYGIKEKTERWQKNHIQVLTREKTGEKVNIQLVDKKHFYENKLQVINQYVEEGGEHSSRYDVTILCNGIPIIHVELKRRGVNIKDAFNQIRRYQAEAFWAGSGLYDWVQLFVISNGTETKYYSNTTRKNVVDRQGQSENNSFKYTTYWTDQNNRRILDLMDFSDYFFCKQTLMNVLTKYCIYNTQEQLLVMRPYQICAVEKTMQRIQQGQGGYVWHTTGSGKTLTSFKLAQLSNDNDKVDRVFFVVDRKDLDYQTQHEYDTFQKGCVDHTTSVDELDKIINKKKGRETKIVITTIQKLAHYARRTKKKYQETTLMIFDECHRSTFGKQFKNIQKVFPHTIAIGFTGTPIFPENAVKNGVNVTVRTTKDLFGDEIHHYTIVDAIADTNVLPFKVEYMDTIHTGANPSTTQVEDINTKGAELNSQRITNIVEHILQTYNAKTCNHTFNAMFATESIQHAIKYYKEFKKHDHNLKIAMVYTYGNPNDDYNEDDADDPSQINENTRKEMENAIEDYNKIFNTGFKPTDFRAYYQDVTKRMKEKNITDRIDLCIVVNMMLTGFDAKTLSTLYVDKNLYHQGLIQAFSRTNRIYNNLKTHGNIVCYRNLEENLMNALTLFGAKEHQNMIILKTFDEYYRTGYTDPKGNFHKPFIDVANEIMALYPKVWFTEPIRTEDDKKNYLKAFSAYLRHKHILESFDEFWEPDCDHIMPEIVEQDYRSHYIGIYEELTEGTGEKADITGDVDFCMELVKCTTTTIDYILDLIKKNDPSDRLLNPDEETLIMSTPQTRPKKELIEKYVRKMSMNGTWDDFFQKEKEAELTEIINKHNLDPQKTRDRMEACFKFNFFDLDSSVVAKLIASTGKKLGMLTMARKRKKMHYEILKVLEGYFLKFSV